MEAVWGGHRIQQLVLGRKAGQDDDEMLEALAVSLFFLHMEYGKGKQEEG